VVAGLEVAAYVFEALDPSLSFTPMLADGDQVASGDRIARVSGRTRSILSGERTALNLLGRMSGVATATSVLVQAVSGTGVRISDTRKTMPGLRAIDKHAVRVGGGMNHRFGLYDAVLIKDNHLTAIGDIAAAVAAARASVGPGVVIEIEVENLDQLARVLETDADRVLLDNMGPELLGQAVDMVGGRLTTEASGGVTVDNVRLLAETGVDIISVGWMTHSAPQLDIALDFT
jgi:nicotinate-nucleotide pyrophosphorylase (carboxylating)